jgi:Na+/proline symporter
MGGFLGTVLSDFMQFIVSVLAMVVLAVVAVQGFGGHEAVLAAVRAAPGYGEQTLSLLPDFTGSKVDLACFVIIVTLWWGDAGGYVMQRLSASRNERDAAKAMVFFAVWQSIRPWMWVVVALVSIALFPVLRAPFSDTHAYPLVMNTYLGVGARGLLLAAFAAAFMSTMTTQLNWGASYLMRDLYERFFRPHASSREKLLVARVATVALAVAGMALAPVLSSITQAWEFFAFLTAGSGLFAVLRWFYWRINAWTELSALILGLACAGANLLLLVLAPEWSVGGIPWVQLRFEFKLLFFTLLVVPTSLLVTWATAPVAEEKLKAFWRKVQPGGWWRGWNDGDAAPSEPALSARALRGVGSSLCLCLGSTLCLGYLVVREPWPALGGLLVALVGAFGTYRWFQKTFSQDL